MVMNTDNGDMPIEKMLSPDGLAEVLNISRRHLDDLRREDLTFPRPLMLGRLPRWSPVVIRQWTQGSAALPATSDEADITPPPAPRRGKRPPRVY
jgi:predicted DNA-binding transcriptional regulator AlpA